ncbi:hypothetical protein Pint_36192 [Pistacia integerrima]|uniref:Uncharacterized protein n=7 Tax=Pistacia TaxID=55512 RepID=A0ACC1A810_9ROSI|nr:hypothetical protein Pint_35843 [Pistacia integerrima]KAJ0083035.1 hypothetical protein Patl1_11225 [Pistacia atlantica]KAJ0028557.1 hypothetical protein Pint_36192 [Pistacia integerrima]KAJ0083110.1 hypothetical protein Patl1_11113 [Pistacia atlantica]KAJ0101185.1 hypothetical protein Patl1_05570 [Pistacia atlantica]
MTMITSSRWC